MSTPIAQGAGFQELEFQEPDLRAGSAEAASASQDDTPAAALSPVFDGGSPAPDAELEPIVVDDAPMQAALAQFNDAVQLAVDLATPLDEAQAAGTFAEPPQAKDPEPWQDGDAVAPLADEEGRRLAEDAVSAMLRLLRDDAESVIEPTGERPSGVRRAFTRHALIVGCAAVAAYGLTIMPISVPTDLDLPARIANGVGAVIAQVKTAEVKTAEVKTGTTPAARLFVKDQQAMANEPLPIEISVQNAVKDTSLRLDGLVAGTRLSAGSPVGVSSWQFPLHDLKSLYLYAPEGFVGVMNSGVDLFGPDRRLIDRRDVRFEWLAIKKSPPPPAAALLTEPKPAIDHPRISAELAETWMARAQGFLNAGDIGAARILFERLANAGSADGAFALAETYDPRYLASHHVIGLAGDDAKAQALYRRAMQMGSAEAGRMVEQATRN